MICNGTNTVDKTIEIFIHINYQLEVRSFLPVSGLSNASHREEGFRVVGELGANTFCLKHSDCDKGKIIIIREGPTEVGRCCSEPPSFTSLRWSLVIPLPTHFLSERLVARTLKNGAK